MPIHYLHHSPIGCKGKYIGKPNYNINHIGVISTIVIFVNVYVIVIIYCMHLILVHPWDSVCFQCCNEFYSSLRALSMLPIKLHPTPLMLPIKSHPTPSMLSICMDPLYAKLLASPCRPCPRHSPRHWHHPLAH